LKSLSRSRLFLTRDFFDPPIEQSEFVFINSQTAANAVLQVGGCEGCNPQEAEIPFDWILDRVTGRDSAVTDYILEAPGRCPYCRREIREKTLVIFDPE
jgi:hypothetical protein